MKLCQVIMIRHGQTIWNLEGRRQGQLNSPLTQIGMQQGKRIAERMENWTYQALYSSDLDRALETAKYISDLTDHEILSDQRLRERNFGILQGLTKEESENNYPNEYGLLRTSGPEYIVPDGESATQFFQRCTACLEELGRNHFGETIAVITHSGVLDCLLRHTLGIPLAVSRRFKVLEGSLNLFDFKKRKWILKTWGDVSHWRETEKR